MDNSRMERPVEKPPPEMTAGQEKQSAAANSVLAAILLTGLKIVVGVLTNSLGILAEAAHSGLDLVAAVVTWFSVRNSDKPPDPKHPYGHGKIENLSALFETGLLLVTCVWIVYEGIHRLCFEPVEVDASVWAFGVIAISIVVDYSRSKMLMAAARKHNSQALEADALHFSTDIWSSAAVLLGLAGVWVASRWAGLHEMHHADAIAALMVAAIVVYISVRLGRRCIDGLLDSAPSGLAEDVRRAVEGLPGVKNCHSVRVRTSGPRVFVDLHATFPKSKSLADVHARTEDIEAAVRKLSPGADVTVHPEPHREALAREDSTESPPPANRPPIR
ncbi:MAG: cation diffusion facilitator family transporter [Planctomycetota bacterium]